MSDPPVTPPKIEALLREAYLYPRATVPEGLVPDLADALKEALARLATLQADQHILRQRFEEENAAHALAHKQWIEACLERDRLRAQLARVEADLASLKTGKVYQVMHEELVTLRADLAALRGQTPAPL